MYWQRLIVSIAILTFTLFVTRSTLAQNQMPRQPSLNDPLSDTEWPRIGSRQIPESSSPRTEIERARDLAGADAQPGYVPQPGAAAGTAGNAVSVEQLRHPLTRKGMKLIKKVESYLKIGQRAKAKEQLAEAMKEPSAAPYAHAILGTEYLRDGKPAAAIPELEDAARVLPIAGVHSNLGYALCLTGHGKRGQQELEEAL